jgi:alpha-L-fucosidase
MIGERISGTEEEERQRRMKWWREAKFGMFIHFGLYSVMGRHEWAMEMEGIPVAEYEPLALRFTPKPNCTRDWIKLARRAGMKYVVMTTKHHEGFCLFDTKYTDYCAPKQACGRDLVAEYVEAARTEGLRFGFYYSLMDWHHPDGARCVENEAARKRFIEYIHGQVRELMTNYGRVDVLWYDVPFPLSAEGWQSAELNSMVRNLQPDIIINDRSGLPEDFSTPEQHVRGETTGRAWEACMTMNQSWGYNKGDDEWKSPKQILRYLITCARDGGNYLLNTGPRADGSVPSESTHILNMVGRWMDKYGDKVYGADPCDVKASAFANFTRKGDTLYIHVLFWPGPEWSIGGLQTKVGSAVLLPSRQPVKFEQNDFRVRFRDLPAKAPDELITVLELECESVPTQHDFRTMFNSTNMSRGKV